MAKRFREYSPEIWDFCTEFLVCCPRCDRGVKVYQLAYIWRITCNHCGYILESQENTQKKCNLGYNNLGKAVDPIFGFTLLLQEKSCNHVLWAYNTKHLKFLESYVNSTLREHLPDDVLGWHNSSLASRLPRWMKLAKNRDKILQSIQNLLAMKTMPSPIYEA